MSFSSRQSKESSFAPPASQSAKVEFRLQPAATLWVLGLVTICLFNTGCHRSFYRRQADAEALRLIDEKSNSEHWSLPNYQMEANPESRMYQPFSLDHPPMPPDDPFANQYMELVDQRPGYPLWHANGDTWYVENPEWRYYLNLNESGELELDFDTAVETALLHSRDYRFQHEELYLSALDVSLERFAFDSQLFAGYNSFFTSDGPDRTTVGQGASNQLSGGTGPRGLRLEKLGTTGSTLIVGFANSLLWEYSGTNDFVGTTFIDFSLIQPLLRRAGRDRIMEALTDSERTLLGNVRQLERFRRGFYLQITTGRSAGSGVSRAGDFISGNAGGGVGFVGGLLGLLRDRQDIQIQEANVSALRSFLDQFREYNRVGRVGQLQVQQSESALYAAQDSLIQAKNDYQTTLDSFKIVLGLPPGLPVKINDPLLDQFQLTDPETISLQNELTEMQRAAGEIIIRVEDRRTEFLVPADDKERITDTTVEGLFWTEQDHEDLLELKEFIRSTKEINRRIREESVTRARADIEKLQSSAEPRKENLTRLRQQIAESSENSTYPVEPEVLAFDRLESGPVELFEDIESISAAFDRIDLELDEIDRSIDQFLELGSELPPVELYRLLYGQILKQVPKQLSELTGRFLELSLVMVRARTDTILRTPVEITPEMAIEIAHRNRRDLMNARADLVDSWRQIEFVANDLESTFDLVFEGDIGNRSDNPLDLRTTTGRLRAGFQFDAPFTRQLERNNYREALVEYDRTRRQFYAFDDEVARSLREIIRNLEQSKISFELSRRSILVAVAQVELARFNLIQPPRPGSERSQLGATTARDLTEALARLQSAQLSFLNVWVTYETLRRTLDFELGTMQLDSQGRWQDPGPLTSELAEALLQQGPLSDLDLPPSIDLTDGTPSFIDESSPFQMEAIDAPAGNNQPGEIPAPQNTTPQNTTPQNTVSQNTVSQNTVPLMPNASETRPSDLGGDQSALSSRWKPNNADEPVQYDSEIPGNSRRQSTSSLETWRPRSETELVPSESTRQVSQSASQLSEKSVAPSQRAPFDVPAADPNNSGVDQINQALERMNGSRLGLAPSNGTSSTPINPSGQTGAGLSPTTGSRPIDLRLNSGEALKNRGIRLPTPNRILPAQLPPSTEGDTSSTRLPLSSPQSRVTHPNTNIPTVANGNVVSASFQSASESPSYRPTPNSSTPSANPTPVEGATQKQPANLDQLLAPTNQSKPNNQRIKAPTAESKSGQQNNPLR